MTGTSDTSGGLIDTQGFVRGTADRLTSDDRVAVRA